MGWDNRLSVPARAGERAKKLIEAAVQAARGKGEAPPPLKYFWQCRNWNALPRAGGVGDQEYRLIWQMTTLANVYYTSEAWFTGKKMTADQEKIFVWLSSEIKGM